MQIGTLRSVRATLVAAVIIVAATGASSTATLHTSLKKASPAVNDTVATSPDSLKLWFSETVELPLTKVLLNGGGSVRKLSAAAMGGSAADAPVVYAVMQTLGAGKYTVDWTVAGKDGHAVKGSYSFVVKAAK